MHVQPISMPALFCGHFANLQYFSTVLQIHNFQPAPYYNFGVKYRRRYSMIGRVRLCLERLGDSTTPVPQRRFRWLIHHFSRYFDSWIASKIAKSWDHRLLWLLRKSSSSVARDEGPLPANIESTWAHSFPMFPKRNIMKIAEFDKIMRTLIRIASVCKSGNVIVTPLKPMTLLINIHQVRQYSQVIVWGGMIAANASVRAYQLCGRRSEVPVQPSSERHVFDDRRRQFLRSNGDRLYGTRFGDLPHDGTLQVPQDGPVQLSVAQWWENSIVIEKHI